MSLCTAWLCKVLFALCPSASIYWTPRGCVILDWTLGLDCLLPKVFWSLPVINMVTRSPLLGGSINGLWKSKCQSSKPSSAIFHLHSLESGQLTPLSFSFLVCKMEIELLPAIQDFCIIFCISTALQWANHIIGPSKWKPYCYLWVRIINLEKFPHFIYSLTIITVTQKKVF